MSHSQIRPVKKSTQKKVSRNPTTQNLFVACLPREVTNAQLLALFQPFGAKTATVMMNTVGRSKGFGFVIFDTAEEGSTAMEFMNANPCATSENPRSTFHLRCSPSNFKAQAVVSESPYMFVRNVPAIISMPQLRRLFGVYGVVKNIVCKNDEHSTGSGHKMVILMVEYACTEEARDAIEAIHGVCMFPDFTNAALMAKFADTATVKSYQRQLRRQSSQTTPQAISLYSTPQTEVLRRAADSPASPGFQLDSPMSASMNSHPYQPHHLPRCFSLDSSCGEASEFEHELPNGGDCFSSAECYPQDRRRSSDYMGLSEYEFPSRRSSADTNTPVAEYMPSEQYNCDSRRVSQSSQQSQGLRGEVGDCWYRNDPYHNTGYVRVSPTSPALSQ